MDFGTLNDRQIEAVEATEGHVRIVAGAGSGKTRTLACRYAYLVNEIGVDPANILCLTFTNKAAQEMRQRISRLVLAGNVSDFVCTIHGFCVKFLREEIFRLGYPKTFLILDEEDLKAFAKEVFADNGIDRSQNTVDDFLGAFGSWKFSHRNYIKDYLLPDRHPGEEQLKDTYVQMLLKQKKNFALDFSDLIYFTLYILDAFPDVRDSWQRRMEYVMVDEVQDCNSLDWEIFTTLSGYHNNLFIVGDPDQSVYEWRGACPDLFVSYQPDRNIVMAQNYRSTSKILDAANSVIVNNRMRLDKDLYTKNDAGETIVHFHGKDEKQEADWIAGRIANMMASGMKASDFAVLYRSSYLSRNIEQAFMRKGIPYVVWGGVRFFERKEIKDALSYLRLVAEGDDVSFTRIVNVPSRKIGKEKMRQFRSLAQARGTTLYEAMKAGVAEKAFSQDGIVRFVEMIEGLRTEAGALRISDLLNRALEVSGLTDLYRKDGDEERLENLTELIESVRLYEKDNREEGALTLQTYLQDIALYTNADYRQDKEKVRLMTIHQAKGLEFPAVFIVGLSEGVFPNQRSLRERKRKALEEERRLMYVAITRAEKHLFLTESEGYSVQSGCHKYPSRFIKEIKSNLFVTEGDMDESLWRQAASMANALDSECGCSPEMSDARFNPGDVVLHKVLGQGTVREVSEDGDYCTVEFDNVNTSRRLRSDKLTPVSQAEKPAGGLAGLIQWLRK
jgi:DNA helicase II / ATP-dependent DNA helicase PcrA